MYDIYNTEEVKCGDVDFGDQYFRIGRKYPGDDLRRSVEHFGPLEPPLLIREGGRYRIVFGFNRIAVISEQGMESFRACVVDLLEREIFLDMAVLKCFRNEVGPVGKVRLVRILREHFGANDDELLRVAESALGMPAEFVGAGLADKMLDLPESVRDYMDQRNVNFRTIKNFLRLPDEGIEIIAGWIDTVYMRVNIFRQIVDMVLDIYNRDGGLAAISGIAPVQSHKAEDFYHDLVLRARYPEYCKMKNEASGIIEFFRSRGVDVGMPEYFEGDSVRISFAAGKRRGINGLRNVISFLDGPEMIRLLDLLG